MPYTCPVCEYSELIDKPENHSICPQCGVEFDYEAPELYPHIRKAWMAAGKPFWRTDVKWREQLHTINFDTIRGGLSAMSTPRQTCSPENPMPKGALGRWEHTNVVEDGDGCMDGCCADYRCTDCGHKWREELPQ